MNYNPAWVRFGELGAIRSNEITKIIVKQSYGESYPTVLVYSGKEIVFELPLLYTQEGWNAKDVAGLLVKAIVALIHRSEWNGTEFLDLSPMIKYAHEVGEITHSRKATPSLAFSKYMREVWKIAANDGSAKEEES